MKEKIKNIYIHTKIPTRKLLIQRIRANDANTAPSIP